MEDIFTMLSIIILGVSIFILVMILGFHVVERFARLESTVKELHDKIDAMRWGDVDRQGGDVVRAGNDDELDEWVTCRNRKSRPLFRSKI